MISVITSLPSSFYPGSPADQTKWLVLRMIHISRIPDPTNGSKPFGQTGLPGSTFFELSLGHFFKIS